MRAGPRVFVGFMQTWQRADVPDAVGWFRVDFESVWVGAWSWFSLPTSRKQLGSGSFQEV